MLKDTLEPTHQRQFSNSQLWGKRSKHDTRWTNRTTSKAETFIRDIQMRRQNRRITLTSKVFFFFDWKHQVLRGVQVKATDITNIAVSQDKGEKGCHKRKKAGIQIDWQAGASPGTTFENPEVLQEKRENLFHPIWNAAALICFDSVSWFLNFALL